MVLLLQNAALLLLIHRHVGVQEHDVTPGAGITRLMDVQETLQHVLTTRQLLLVGFWLTNGASFLLWGSS